MSVSEKGWIFDDDDKNDNDDGEKSNGKPYTQLFWASIIISGGSVINMGYSAWCLPICRVGVKVSLVYTRSGKGEKRKSGESE